MYLYYKFCNSKFQNPIKMNQCDVVEKSLLERIQSELEADPDLFDVTFSVGPQKTKVEALKIILWAASPVFKNKFKTKWDHAVMRDGEGIPLPEFDGESFQLFVKLTSLDTWSFEVLSNLNLPPNQLLDLLCICRRYEIRTAVKNLEKLTASFLQSFAKFKDTADFLTLSQANLKEVLASDDLPLEEMEVFKCALKWADSKCKEKELEASMDNLRHVLRDCLFEIRFPTMSIIDFTNAMELKELLSARQTFKMYKYFGLDESKRQQVDVRSLGFNAKRRNSVLLAKQESKSAELCLQQRQTPASQTEAQASKVKPSPSVQPKGTPTAKPLGCSTLSLLSESRKIDSKTPFVCDGKEHDHMINPEQSISVVGLGFAGPIDGDALYDVTVEMWDNYSGEDITNETLKKTIFALKGQTFYFLFDQPVTVEPPQFGVIYYSLKGPNTSSIVGGHDDYTELQEGSNRFGFSCYSSQLSEILFK